MLQTIITPLCITLVVCGILFFYFRSRLSLTETKVNLMFELIQEHENQRKLMSHNFHPMIPPEVLQNTEKHAEQSDNKENALDKHPSLIDVSDDEMSESDESDSDMSENDDDERLTMGQTLADDEGIKSVTLTLEGAETGAKPTALNDLAVPQEVITETLDKTDIKEISINKEGMSPDDIDDINLSGADSSCAEDEDSDDDDDETEDDVHNENNNDKTVVHKLPENKPFDKWKVKDLKQECANRGLDNYKKMKKTALVDLLNNAVTNTTGVN